MRRCRTGSKGTILKDLLKRNAGNHLLNTNRKPASANFTASKGPTRFTSVSGIYDSKVNPVGQLETDKLGATVLLYVFNIGLPVTVFQEEN